MAREQFTDTIVDIILSRIQYKIATYPEVVVALLEMAVVGEDICLCHREDAPGIHYYYLELSQQQFLAMGGKELDNDNVL